MNEAKNWYLSKTIWGGAVAILSSCGNLVGIDIVVEEQAELVDALTALAAAAGGLVAIYGRISARQSLR